MIVNTTSGGQIEIDEKDLLDTYLGSMGLPISKDANLYSEDGIISSVIGSLSRPLSQFGYKILYQSLEKLLKTYYPSDNSKRLLKEKVNHPKHYNQGEIETIELLRLLGKDKDFAVGNAIKYLSRYKYKENPVEDLEKAIWYVAYLGKD